MNTILDKLKWEKKNMLTYPVTIISNQSIEYWQTVPNTEFLDTMVSYFMYPFFNRPIWHVKESGLLIENIYSNISKHDILTGVFYTDITDHFPILYRLVS